MAYWHHNQVTDHRLATLGNAAKILGQFLAGRIDDHDQWRMSRDRMKTTTGMSLSSINKALAELEDAGVIVGRRQGRRTSTQYVWALSCPPGCDEESHHESVEGKQKKSARKVAPRVHVETTEPHTETTELHPETTKPHTTESTELLTTYTSVNKSVKTSSNKQETEEEEKLVKTQADSDWQILTALVEEALETNPTPNITGLAKAIKTKPAEVAQSLELIMSRAKYNRRNFMTAALSNTPAEFLPELRKSPYVGGPREWVLDLHNLGEHFECRRGEFGHPAGSKPQTETSTPATVDDEWTHARLIALVIKAIEETNSDEAEGRDLAVSTGIGDMAEMQEYLAARTWPAATGAGVGKG